ncbi:type IVB secretion system protein IcmN/DotK [Legionella sp. 16cNR16C]|uniref:type IVB secretion system protein IcmN/DotK n=1 Tax=Legionella sp. 16cNR16C TaxID=2905656 RepID=UPI001E36B5FA|nr:type IVB secretion system protein IcmN/DotK [Legionella sp. 16cNR16C]
MRRTFFDLLKSIVLPVSLLATSVLPGCSSKGGSYPIDEGVKLPGKVQNSSDSAVMSMQSKFKNMGVKVITIGSDYLISIPSAALFADQSPRLTWQSYAILNDVAQFMKMFRKVSVTVTAYSNKYLSCKREQALTLTRARSVADYLWSQCIDSRFIFVEGAGSDKPIVGIMQGGDQSPNSRIEITFRDAIV